MTVPRYIPGSAARIGGWPRSVAECDHDEVARTAEELRAQHLAAWQDYGQVLDFLADHLSDIYRMVRECRKLPHVGRNRRRARVVLEGCGIVPYCLACTDEEDRRKAGQILTRMRACTPKGRALELRTWVFSANVPASLDSWGMSARERIADFKKTVRETLADIHGAGYGASLAYHDVGEVGFAKPNPHVDVIVNGWTIRAGRVKRLPFLDLTHGAKPALGAAWMRRIKREFPLADPNVWDIHTQYAADAERDVWTIAKYHAREVINLRHLEYNRRRQTVQWTSDKEQFHDPTLSVDRFKHEIRDYVRRTGGFRSLALRGYTGHLSNGVISTSAAACGNAYNEHRPDCSCTVCMGWEWSQDSRVELPEEENEAFGPG